MARSYRLEQTAILVMILAAVTSLKLAVGDPVGIDAPFLLYPLVILLCGWWWGARSAALVTVIGALLSWYLFMPANAWFKGTALIRLSAFLVEGFGLSAIVGAMHRSREKVVMAAALSEAAKGSALEASEKAETSASRIAQLQRLTAALSAAHTPEAVGRVVVEEGVEALGATSGAIVRPREDGMLEVFAQRGLSDSLVRSKSAFAVDAQYPTAVAIRTGKPEWIEDPALYAERYQELSSQHDGTFAAAATVPLSVDGRVIGAMAFRFAKNHTFDEAERALLLTFAGQAAQAFERATLFEEETAARKMMQTLAELNAELSQALHRAEVVALVLEGGMQAVGADTCTLHLLDERDGSLDLVAEHGCAPEIVNRIRRIPRSNDNPFIQQLESGLSLWVEDERQYREVYPNFAELKVEGTRAKAFWSVPLIVGGRAIGLLGMGFYEPQHFSASTKRFVQTFAQPCAQALRRAEQLAREQEARRAAEQARSSLSTTLRSIGDAVMATDSVGCVTFMNPVAEELTGWSEEDARGRPLRSVFHIVNETTRCEVESPVDKVLREGRIVGLANHTVLVGKRREVPIDDSGSPICDESGEIQGVVLVFRDVSAKKQDEARRTFLSDASLTLSSSLDHRITLTRTAELAVPRLADWCAIHLVGPAGTGLETLAVTHVDPAKVELARELQRRFPPDPNASGGPTHVIRTGRSELFSEIPDELLAQSARNEEHLLLLRQLGLRSLLTVPLTARGEVFGVIMLGSAESNRRYGAEDLAFAEDFAGRAAVAVERARFYAAEQRAREVADASNRTKDEFLATVSHELRTPLTAILGWVKLLAEAEFVEPEHERAVTVIERNAVAMAQLIDDLLDVSSIISGKMRLNVASVDLAQIVEAAIDSVKPAADAKEIEIRSRLEPGADSLLGDPARLQQIVWNLLNNAVKFTPKRGHIDIVLQRVDSSVEISVSDTGQGIDPAFLPYVFDRFRQADGSITRTHGGLGLGLAITRHLVELHGGHVEARSQGESRGATFVVRLPIPAVREPLSTSPARRGRTGPVFEIPPSLTGLHVLVVEDEEDARQLVQTVLSRCGSRVTAVDSAMEAMRAIEREKPDVLISDIGMPGENGYDLIKKVRALPASKGGNLPAAALTAYARVEDRLRVLNAGYMMHIPKPVEPAELVAIVASLTRFLSP